MASCRKSCHRNPSNLYGPWMLAPACRRIQAVLSKALLLQCTAGLTRELLQDVPAGTPNSKLLDYWATVSSCLTDSELFMDPADKQHLQPAYLNQLTRLTRLAFGESDDSNSHEEDGFHYAFELPELKVLSLECLWASDLRLQCPQLKHLRIVGCYIGKVYLQASLESLHHMDSVSLVIHEGFPITNLIGLTYLSFNVSNLDITSEAVLFQGLPLMTRLRVLDLLINMCSLPASLPSSLQNLTIYFSHKRVWDSSVIPLLQQLPGVETIRIYTPSLGIGFIGDRSLDHDLRPFLAINSLKILQLGDSHMWRPSALRQLGELEAEVVRLGKTLELIY